LVGIHEFFDIPINLTVSPNPNNGQFEINYELPQNEQGFLEIINILGEVVYSHDLVQWSSVHRLSLDVSSGLYTIILCCVLGLVSAQERVLKDPQPNLMQLTHFVIKLNPNDTIFNSVDFSHLPVKGFPFYTATYKQPFYTVEQRDSILMKIDEMFFEPEKSQ
jgi:hypothetical protein